MCFLHWGSNTGSGTPVPSEYLGKLDKHICHPPGCSAFGFFCCQGTLLAHAQLALCLDTRAETGLLFWRAAPLHISPSQYCCRGSSFSSTGFCIYPWCISLGPSQSIPPCCPGPSERHLCTQAYQHSSNTLMLSPSLMSKHSIISSTQLLKRLNRIGSRTDPYSTQLVTSLQVEHDIYLLLSKSDHLSQFFTVC